MNTQENNKIIAEFMGITPNEAGVYHVSKHKGYSLENLLYHTSWDWLMPVVEKIESILPCDSIITIEYKDCRIPVNESGFDIVTNEETKIEAVYKAVVEFINQYNQ